MNEHNSVPEDIFDAENNSPRFPLKIQRYYKMSDQAGSKRSCQTSDKFCSEKRARHNESTHRTSEDRATLESAETALTTCDDTSAVGEWSSSIASVSGGEDSRRTQVEKKQFLANYENLMKELEPDDVNPSMVSGGHFCPEDVEFVAEGGRDRTRRARAYRFLQLVWTKGVPAFNGFLKALRDNGYDQAVKKIETTNTESIQLPEELPLDETAGARSGEGQTLTVARWGGLDTQRHDNTRNTQVIQGNVYQINFHGVDQRTGQQLTTALQQSLEQTTNRSLAGTPEYTPQNKDCVSTEDSVETQNQGEPIHHGNTRETSERVARRLDATAGHKKHTVERALLQTVGAMVHDKLMEADHDQHKGKQTGDRTDRHIMQPCQTSIETEPGLQEETQPRDTAGGETDTSGDPALREVEDIRRDNSGSACVSLPRPDLNQDQEQLFPLHQACRRGDLEKLNSLINDTTDLQARDDRGWTALELACDNGREDVVRRLVEQGADVKTADDEKMTPLHFACKRGPPNIVDILIDAGANVNATNDVGFTPLWIAVEKGDLGTVETLLRKKADPNIQEKHGMSPLMHATQCAKTDIMKALLECSEKADVAMKDLDGYTALHFVQTDEGVRLLLKHEAPIEEKEVSGLTPLALACSSNKTEAAQALIKQGAIVNTADKIGFAPLHLSVLKRNKELVELLIEKGADINARTCDNETPLHLACEEVFEDMVRLLLKGGANVNARTKDNVTPLGLTRGKGYKDIVYLLKQSGATL